MKDFVDLMVEECESVKRVEEVKRREGEERKEKIRI